MDCLWIILGASVYLVTLVSSNVEPTLPAEPYSSSSPSSVSYDSQLNSTEINSHMPLLVGAPIKVWATLQALPVKLDVIKRRYRSVQINWETDEVFEGDWVALFEDEPKGPIAKPPPDYFTYSGDGADEYFLSTESPYNSEDFSSEMTPSEASYGEWYPSESSLEAEELLQNIPSSEAPTVEKRSLQQDDQNAPLFSGRPYATRGVLTSNISAPRPSAQKLASGGCVGVWVAYIRDNMPIATNCIRSHPNWLWDNRDVLGDRPIRSLILPGMHNAGSYDVDDEIDAVTNWVICHDEDVLSQLLYGGRYLDLRVGYYPHRPEKLWINHDLVKWRPLKDVLLQIHNFTSLSVDPIFVDFHRFPVGFQRPEAMPLLLKLLNDTLGHQNFLSSHWGPHITLNQIWNLDQRIILSLSNKTIVSHTDWLWPALPQAWANAQNPNDLRKYVDTQMTKRCLGERMWATMLQMTPSFWDVLIRGHLGIRGFADMVSSKITRWLVQRWVHCANVIAVDFIRGTNIVEVSIELNTNMEAIVSLIEENEKIRSNKVKINFTDTGEMNNENELSNTEFSAHDLKFSHRTWRTIESSNIKTDSHEINKKIVDLSEEQQNDDIQSNNDFTKGKQIRVEYPFE